MSSEQDTVHVLGVWGKDDVQWDDFKLDLPPFCKVECVMDEKQLLNRQKEGTVALFTVKLTYVCLRCTFTALRKADFDKHLPSHENKCNGGLRNGR
jgi:hypothetical protein